MYVSTSGWMRWHLSHVLILLTAEKAMTATTNTTTTAASTPSSHGIGILPSRSVWLLGRFFTAHSLPGTGVTVGVARGAGVYLRPLNRLCARGSPAACCSWQAWQLSSTWQLKQVGVP